MRWIQYGFALVLVLILAVDATPSLASTENAYDHLQKLSSDFWAWRARYAPFSGDAVNRMERPPAVLRDWSRTEIDAQRQAVTEFETRRKQADPNRWPVAQQGDCRLIGSALSRVRWELDVNHAHEH